MEVLGVDIGGTGIKGAPVNTETGELLAARHRTLTPQPANPEPVAGTVEEIRAYFNWEGPIGCGFPAVVKDGVTMTAANVDASWINTNIEALISKTTGLPTRVLNDADAAGLAEMKFGAGRDRGGVVIVVTIGTGLGTAMFTDGHLVPNMELGHIEINGFEAEIRAADSARKREELTWKKWSKRLNTYLQSIEKLLWPNLIILGGGVSKKHHKFLHRLDLQAEVAPAQLRNEAGIVGAALAGGR